MNEITAFWDVTLCSLLDVCRRFGGRYYLHVQDSRVCRALVQMVPIGTSFGSLKATNPVVNLLYP
jgi:hypothetical protein